MSERNGQNINQYASTETNCDDAGCSQTVINKSGSSIVSGVNGFKNIRNVGFIAPKIDAQDLDRKLFALRNELEDYLQKRFRAEYGFLKPSEGVKPTQIIETTIAPKKQSFWARLLNFFNFKRKPQNTDQSTEIIVPSRTQNVYNCPIQKEFLAELKNKLSQNNENKDCLRSSLKQVNPNESSVEDHSDDNVEISANESDPKITISELAKFEPLISKKHFKINPMTGVISEEYPSSLSEDDDSKDSRTTTPSDSDDQLTRRLKSKFGKYFLPKSGYPNENEKKTSKKIDNFYPNSSSEDLSSEDTIYQNRLAKMLTNKSVGPNQNQQNEIRSNYFSSTEENQCMTFPAQIKGLNYF